MIRARVQHHPSRAHLLPALLEALSPIPTEVIAHESDPPSPWAGYLKCMERLPRSGHILIVQDDAVPSQNFASACDQIAKAQPEYPVCLFLSRLPRDASRDAKRAMMQGRRYSELKLRSFMPVVAVLWPVPRLREFRDWAVENPRLFGRTEPRSDDAMAGRWKLVTRQRVKVCVPSIVEHPDQEPSTIGRLSQWGRDKGRCAELLAEDALEFDWSTP